MSESIRTYLDNSELLTAAECLESLAQALEDEGDHDGADAQRDTAAAMRHIAKCALLGHPTEVGHAGIKLPVIEIAISATCEVE